MTTGASPRALPAGRLLEDDVLFYLHIPKTAGLSLISSLDAHFAGGRIFPLHSAPHEKMMKAFTVEQFQDYRFVRGHFQFGRLDRRVYKYIVQAPRMLTILRAPGARLISAYRHALRRNNEPWMNRVVRQGQTLRQFIEDPAAASRVWNVETRMVVGAAVSRASFVPGWGRIADAALLALAREHLEQYAFVGVVERFAETLQALCLTFGWDPPTDIPWLNRAPTPSSPAELDDETRAALERCTALDRELYQFASRLFEQRLAEIENREQSAGEASRPAL